jgi:hypothetical protein
VAGLVPATRVFKAAGRDGRRWHSPRAACGENIFMLLGVNESVLSGIAL